MNNETAGSNKLNDNLNTYTPLKNINKLIPQQITEVKKQNLITTNTVL